MDGLAEGGDGEDEGEEDEDHVHCTTRTWKLSSEDLGSEEPHADAKISYQLDQIF